MVLPLFTFDATSMPEVGSVVTVSGSEAKHAATVRRMRIGEGIQLANGRGLRVVGTVDSVLPSQLAVRVAEVIVEELPEPQLTLVQALAKGDRDELAIQAATELGVSGVIPWQADRSISRWDGPKVAKGLERWKTIVTEAAKQALRAFTPEVAEPVATKQLAGLVRDFSAVLVLDPTAAQALSTVTLPTEGRVAIVVGPEGGISDAELTTLEEAGAIRVRLGSEILRTSTAGMAAISVLQSRLGRW
ncbi:MAG: hypothetical protein RLZ69_939 [Actinomycetota bacterium]